MTCTTAAFAQRVSVARDKSIESTPYAAKRKRAAQYTQYPGRSELSRQQRYGIPSHVNLSVGSDYMQFAETRVQGEPAVDLLQCFRQNRYGDGLLLLVQEFQPRDASLANFALAIVQSEVLSRAILLSGNVWLVNLY
jgi:hypothetical protein